MIKKVGLVVNRKKRNSAKVEKTIISYLKRKKIKVISDEDMTREEVSALSDLIIVLGGDGTLLNVAKFVVASSRNPLILGVNLGGLGFLTETSIKEVKTYLDKVIRGKYNLSRRMAIEAVVIRRNSRKRYIGINDVVISRGALSRIISLKVDVGGEYLSSHMGDGLIISTPTGSTAHSLAAGGPIIHPGLDSIIITPICPHTLSNRPIVIPSGMEIKVEVMKNKGLGEVAVMIDGQLGASLRAGDKVLVKAARKKLKLIGSPTLSYFQILREKLGWQVRRYYG